MMLLLLPLALAGETALYQSAYKIIEVNYLRPALVDPQRMFLSVGEHLEDRIEWLLVDSGSDMSGAASLTLTDGAGKWTQTIVLRGDLPAALSQIEDAVRAAGLPLDPEFNLPVEILRGMVKPLDKHSVVLSGDSLERFDQRLSGKLSGIGATITVRDNKVVVKALNPDSPALRGGLQVGDVLLRIGGVSTVGMDVNDAVDRIRGPEKTKVTLTIDRQGQVMELVFERVALTIPNVRASVGPHEVGVLTIENFSEQTEAYLRSGLAELQAKGVLQNGLIIDLRGNTGGSLIQSAKAVDAFVNSGVIVTTTGRDGRPLPGLIAKIEAKPEDNGWNMPIAVLMDHDTASGSEILAGGLSLLDRAILIGQTSFGKGTVQKTYALGPDTKLKLTVAEYFVRGDVQIADRGLAPDLAMEALVYGERGVWYADPSAEERFFTEQTRVLHYSADSVSEGGTDPTLEAAARIVRAAGDSTRATALRVMDGLLQELDVANEQEMIEVLRGQGVDWSPMPAGGAPPTPMGRLVIEPSAPPVAGEKVELHATFFNDGPELYRAAIRLRSVNRAWDDRVIPLGHVPANGTVAGRISVELASGPGRVDQVEAILEAEAAPPTRLLQTQLAIAEQLPPPIELSARLVNDVNGQYVSLELENHGEESLGGVHARFDFPDVEGIELLEGPADALVLAPRKVVPTALGLRLSPNWTEPTLPLTLVIASEEYRRLLSWELALPRDGSAVTLLAPTISYKPLPATTASTTLTLQLRVSDDGPLDHVLVYAGTETMDRQRYESSVKYNSDKRAWVGGEGRKKLTINVDVPVEPGTNRYVIVAEDAAGLRTIRELYVLGG